MNITRVTDRCQNIQNKQIDFFFYLGFLSQAFTNHRTAGKGGGHFCNSSLALLLPSETLRHQPGDYCRELTSARTQQPDSNQEPLVSERKLLTTKLDRLRQIETDKQFGRKIKRHTNKQMWSRLTSGHMHTNE